MYTLLRLLPLNRLAVEQFPPLAASVILAERCYKFHSFTLECVGFLATWFVLDALFTWIRRSIGRPVHPSRERTQEH
jgi:hypothetical protein